jgi:carnitine O-palmitoyltransferase 1
MAEAHQAVAFSFAITHEGWNVNYDREVLHLVWESGVRSWKKRVARIKAGIRNGAYPAHLESLYVILILVTLLHFSSKRVPYDLVNTTMNVMPR